MDNSDPLKKDFRNFLFVVFLHLNIQTPTNLQYDIAFYLQHGPDRLIVEGFRGVGKSWITAAYVLWILYCDPNKKILVVSSSKDRAAMFTNMLLRLIQEMPILKHLKPRDDQRQSTIMFDVNGSDVDQTPSVRAVGITGNMTGGRADVIVPDDVENQKNSMTEMLRQKLAEAVKEFDAILKPGGLVRYLGTPQCEKSLYNELQKRGYVARIWPARYPNAAQIDYYGTRLAPAILEGAYKNEGKPTEPSRFPELELVARQASYGRSGFSLQFMLNTRLSDQHRFPLHLNDLLVMYCNDDKGPECLVWGPAPEKIWNELPNMGMNGDYYYQPMQVQGEWLDYTGALMTIDPSGRGKDETAYTITKVLNGYIYLLDCGGYFGGATDENLKALVASAKKYKVKKVEIEANFGDGMFTRLISPHFERDYPVTIEEVKHTTQKELRIIDTLEPILTQHRLVVDVGCIKRDFESVQAYDEERAQTYSLFYQLTNITRDRQSLIHDDRLDALAMAAAHWHDHLARDVGKQMAKRKEEERVRALAEFVKSFGKANNRSLKPVWNTPSFSR